MLKTCSRCHASKQVEEFGAHKCRPDGLRGVCKSCAADENRADYLRNQAKRQADARIRSAEWRTRSGNAEKNRTSAAAWYRSNRTTAIERADAWRRAHPDRERASRERCKEQRKAASAAWRAANKANLLEKKRQWQRNNRAKLNEKNKRYRLNNLAKMAAKEAQRRAALFKATPSWANLFFIGEAYDLAQKRTEATGFEWSVDHMVPLDSKTVCGLHTEQNLRVIPHLKNISKGNRYWPDMP